MASGGTLTTALVSRNLSASLGGAVDRNGAALAEVLAGLLQEPLAYGDRLTARQTLTGVQERNPDVVYAFVADPSGGVGDHSFPTGRFPGGLLSVLERASPVTLRTEQGLVRDIRAPVAEGVLGTVHVGLSLNWVRRTTTDAMTNVALITLLGMVVGVLGILFLAHLITSPLRTLRSAVDRLGRGEGLEEVRVDSGDEIGDLAVTFNRMAKQIRERVEESDALRAYMERILDQMESSILVISRDRVVEHANAAAFKRHGDLKGHVCSDALAGERPCDVCPISRVLEEGAVVRQSFRTVSGRSYELKWMPVPGRDGRPAVVERALDVTEREELQERFQRAQRLAVAGEISAGIVHSVNNPLDGVRRALDLAVARPDDAERVSRMLGLAREGTERIASITRTLLGFARAQDATHRVAVDVASLLEAAANVARLTAESGGVEIHLRIEEGLPPIPVDPSGVEEVVVNLLLNAVDACAGGGRVEVTAHRENMALVLFVRDDGPGVPAELADTVFEPFFTTKDAGRGTGLGLSVARRIVEAHGGDLTLESVSPTGAAFRAVLPYPPSHPPEEPHER